MTITKLSSWLLVVWICTVGVHASGQSFRVQCPTSTITHPDPTNKGVNNGEPAYTGPTSFTSNTSGMYLVPSGNVNGAIKCQQISGGDGYATMGDGTQTFMFSFGPLSGLADIASGQPGTEFPNIFNTVYPGTLAPGDPATTDGAGDAGAWIQGTWNENSGAPFLWNGAVGLSGDTGIFVAGPGGGATASANVVTGLIGSVTVNSGGSGYAGPPTVTFAGGLGPGGTAALGTTSVSGGQVTAVNITYAGTGYISAPTVVFGPASNACFSGTPPPSCLDGHVDPRQVMDVGVMNGNIPAPLIAIDEDDEFFLTLTNVGMIMRPDLFEQHTVHFHGYPNASSFYDGVPDASVAINIGGSFTYYYLAPDAGTYFWHCHITPPEHLQMGMVGQLYVRPRQNRVLPAQSLYDALQAQQGDLRTACNPVYSSAHPDADILCTASLPAVNTSANQGTDKFGNPQKYTYNDGDGTTAYDVEYPLQIHGFDPNFHFVGMTFNPEMFVDMKDKYFLLNGRSYPDTVTAGPLATQSSDGRMHYSQPLPAIINIPVGGKALLRISDLDVSEYQTLASLGIPMTVVGYNAKLLRDQEGHNMYYTTNSITLGGGESLDVILDATDSTSYPHGSIYYLYTSNLDHLANDAENFGGLMTEVRIN